MNTIYERIKDDRRRAMLSKSEDKDFYPYLLGLIENKCGTMQEGIKVFHDKDTIPVLKSLVKTYHDMLEIIEDEEFKHAKSKTLRELEIVEKYLPKQLTEEDIRLILQSSDLKTLAEMMKYLKENYSGQYDGKLASDVSKSLEFLSD